MTVQDIIDILESQGYEVHGQPINAIPGRAATDTLLTAVKDGKRQSWNVNNLWLAQTPDAQVLAELETMAQVLP